MVSWVELAPQFTRLKIVTPCVYAILLTPEEAAEVAALAASDSDFNTQMFENVRGAGK